MVLTTACCELALACQHLLPVRRSLQRTLAAWMAREKNEKMRWQKGKKRKKEKEPGRDGFGLVGLKVNRGSVVELEPLPF